MNYWREMLLLDITAEIQTIVLFKKGVFVKSGISR